MSDLEEQVEFEQYYDLTEKMNTIQKYWIGKIVEVYLEPVASVISTMSGNLMSAVFNYNHNEESKKSKDLEKGMSEYDLKHVTLDFIFSNGDIRVNNTRELYVGESNIDYQEDYLRMTLEVK